jgi:taspase (threonine aspartase 1)
LDGTMDKMFKRTPASKGSSNAVASIFVHAGAGYHSSQNEHVHLGACDR